jgi:hypothetical protein
VAPPEQKEAKEQKQRGKKKKRGKRGKRERRGEPVGDRSQDDGKPPRQKEGDPDVDPLSETDPSAPAAKLDGGSS